MENLFGDDSQEQGFKDLIYLMTSKMRPEHLSRAMVGVMFNAMTHGVSLAETLGRICQIYFRNYSLCNSEFDLSKYGLVKKSLELPEGFLRPLYSMSLPDKYTSYYFPFRALFPNIPFCKTPAEARAIFGITGQEPWFINLVKLIKDYALSKSRITALSGGSINIDCALTPMTGVLEIPLLLFMVSDLLDDVKINFKLCVSPDEYKNWKELDIGYGAPFYRNREEYTTTSLYTREELPLLLHKKFFHGNDDNIYCVDFSEFNLNEKAISDVLIGKNFIEKSKKQIKLIPKNEDFLKSEYHILIALACGILPESTGVIPSIYGYLWVKEMGLIETDLKIYDEDKKCGVIFERRIKFYDIHLSPFTLFLRNYEKCENVNNPSLFLIDALFTGYFYIHDYCGKDSTDEKKLFMASALMAPFFNNLYQGFLTCISSDLLLNSIIGCADESYLNYKPLWWDDYKKIFD